MVIVYKSETGFTKQYAQLLAQETGMQAYTVKEAAQKLEKGCEIIYMGWLMAGHISGLDKATSNYVIHAACGVGMSIPSTAVLTAMQKSNYLADGTLFYLRGGYAPAKLKGIKRLMLNMVLKGMRNRLMEKPARTEEDLAQLKFCNEGGSYVSADALAPLVAWIQAHTSAVKL